MVESLRTALERHGEPTPGVLRLPAQIARVVKYDLWRPLLDRALCEPGEEMKPNLLRAKRKRVYDLLVARRVIGRDDPYVWIAREPSA